MRPSSISLRQASLVLALFLVSGLAGAATYKIDSVHSSVVFKVRHLGASNFYGTFNDIQGTIEFDPANPAAGSVAFEIPAESVYTRNEGRDRHLKSPDFLNAKQFPVIRFTSQRVEKVGDGRFRVTGELDLHGVKKTVSGEVEHVGTGKHPRSGAEIVGFETILNIDRTEFGMDYMAVPDGLGTDVQLTISVEAAAE